MSKRAVEDTTTPEEEERPSQRPRLEPEEMINEQEIERGERVLC